MSSLHPDHLADLQKSGLTDETILEAGIYSVPPHKINKIMGWNAPVNSILAFPYPGTNFERFKLFPSLTDKNGHTQKYTQVKGSPVRLYVPPGFRCWEQIWRITEGEKKALKGSQERLNVLALGGVWNFAIKNGDGEPVLIDDLKGIPWESKTVEIIPDGDFKKKEQVAHSVYRLACMLEKQGARVVIVELPGNEKLDDYLCKNDSEAFLRLPRIQKNHEYFGISKIREDRKTAESRKELQFPDIYSGVAGLFSKLYESRLEVPRHFFFMAFLSCLGNVLSKKITIASLLKPQPRLYVLLLGESSDSRKSTAIAVTTSFFRETLTEFAVSWGIGSAEGLQKTLKDNPILLLTFDEFSLFVQKCGIKNSTLLSCVTSLFEQNHYQNRTKNELIELNDVYLSILAASTRDTFEKVWNSTFTSIGFNNRLFIVPGDSQRKFPIPGKLSINETMKLKSALGDVFSFVGNGIELEMSEEARGLYDHWYMGIERSVHARRIDTYSARFLSLIAANDMKEIVDVETVEKVIELCNWQLRVRKLYDPIDANNEVAKMESRIKRELTFKPLTNRELQRATTAHRSGLWCYGMALKNLQHAGQVDRTGKFYVFNKGS